MSAIGTGPAAADVVELYVVLSHIEYMPSQTSTSVREKQRMPGVSGLECKVEGLGFGVLGVWGVVREMQRVPGDRVQQFTILGFKV